MIVVMVVEVLIIDVRADVVMGTLAGVKLIAVAAVMIALELPVPISYFLVVLSDMMVDVLIDGLAGVPMGFVTGICVEVLADANVKVFESLINVFEFFISCPLGKFRR